MFSNLHYKKDFEGHVPKLICQLDNETVAWITAESNKERERINRVERIAPILSANVVQLLIEFIVERMEANNIELDLSNDFEYKGLKLTLYYYLKTKGELEDNAELVSLAETVQVITALGSAEIANYRVTPEMARDMYISGIKTGNLDHYEKISRRDGFAEHNQNQHLESQVRVDKIIGTAKELRLKYPDIPKKEIAEMLSDKQEYGNLSAQTIVKKLRGL